MSKYNRKQQIIINLLDNIARLNSGHPIPALIKQIILERPIYLPMFIQRVDVSNTTNTRSVAESFNSRCYQSMTNDHQRVSTYKQWIDHTWNSNDQRWLEIGPGTDICLGKLLLDDHQDTYYTGIEINDQAYKSASMKLQKYKNASIHKGFLNESFNKLPVKVDVILHEILGVIASAEGVGLAMSYLKTKYPNAISIPEYVSTHLVLLDMRVSDIIKDLTLTINHKMFRGTIPFARCQISDDHAILEQLHMNNISLQQKHRSKCKIKRDGYMSVLGIYITLMTYDISTSSNSDDPNASANWANIGLVLPTSIQVKRNKIVTITSEIDIRSMEPNYTILLEYDNYKYQWHIRYGDLYGEYEYLHTVKI